LWKIISEYLFITICPASLGFPLIKITLSLQKYKL